MSLRTVVSLRVVPCVAVVCFGCSAPIGEIRRHMEEGNVNQALADAEKVIASGWWIRDGDRGAAHAVAGDAWMARGSIGLALHNFRRAIELAPSTTPSIRSGVDELSKALLSRPDQRALTVTLLEFLSETGVLDRGQAVFLATHRPKALSLVLVGVDTVRADHLGCYGYPVDTSPAIDRLAREGIRFENAFSTSPWTCPSFMSAFTGLPPLAHGSFQYPEPFHIPREIPTLASELHAAGFITAAYTEGGFVRPQFGFEQGFDFFPNDAGRPHPDQKFEDPLAVNAERTIAFLNRHRDSRFAVWLHTYRSHVPLAPEPELEAALGADWAQKVERLIPPDRDLAIGAQRLWSERHGSAPKLTSKMLHDHIRQYDAALLAADRAIESVLNAVEDLGLKDTTLVVFFADHGEGLMDHGLLEHGRNFYRELTRVPLIWRAPGQVAGVERTPVSLMGLSPSILGTLGFDDQRMVSDFAIPFPPVAASVDSETFDGALLMQGLAAVEGEHDAAAIICWPYQLVAHASGHRELYDLVDDPAQLLDLASSHPDEVTRCEELLGRMESAAAEHAQRIGAAGSDLAVTMDDATRDRLRLLGYVE